MGSVFDDYVLPEGARDDLIAAGVKMQNLNGDASVQVMSGHHKGVAFRFFEHAEKNEAASKAAKYAVYDKFECVEWLKSKRQRPVERLRFLPETLLYVDPDTGEASGQWAEAYRRWKQGLNAPGLPLSKWGVLDIADLAILVDAGIFSVEQFAALPRGRVEGRFRPSIVAAFDEAIEYTRRQQGLVESDELAKKVVELEAKIAKLTAEKDGQVQPTAKAKAKNRKKPGVQDGDQD